MPVIFPGSNHTLVGAHRGASTDAPENTLAAFDLAVAQGADLIECDVHCTHDGHLVVHHDFELGRTAGIRARIGDLSFSEIEAFDVGAWKGPEFAGQHVPSLSDVLRRYGAHVLLNIEIKVDRVPYEGIEQAVAEAVAEHGLVDRVVVSSFDAATVLRLRRGWPQLRASLLFESAQGQVAAPESASGELLESAMSLAAAHELAGLHLEHDIITQEVVRRADQMSIGVLAWTVDDADEMHRLLALGIDAILSNRPALLRQVVMA